MEEEVWREVPGWEGFYEASSLGFIRSMERAVYSRGNMLSHLKGKVLSPISVRNGYPRVVLFKDGVRYRKNIHRIIATTFLTNPGNKKTINHKNGIKTDNRVENLEWATHGENNRHAYRTGLKKAFPKGNPARKGALSIHAKTVLQFSKEGNLLREWGCGMDALRETGINNISACCSGRLPTAGGFIWKFKDSL